MAYLGKVEELVYSIVDECGTNSQIIIAGFTLISSVITTIKQEPGGYEAAEHTKHALIYQLKEL